ncbi:MAG: hypothetical protein KatS3mg105_3295 [Gemmatales bacterium]|nr:MAG: hypothetical protein KatS3mg105_3295 [Gemmatales bacterium]
MAEATILRERHDMRLTAAAAIASGEVYQLPDGRAGVYCGLNAASSGDRVKFATSGQFTVAKASNVEVIDGAPLWWDHSANAATPVPQFGSRDFFIGSAVGDAAASASTCVVNLNVKPEYIVDINGVIGGGGGDTVTVQTTGSPSVVSRGGMTIFAFDTTAEAQKVDWLSRRSFDVASNWILEAMVEVATAPNNVAADVDIGVASGTHASDFESIAEFAAIHLDGGDTNIDAHSDDGTTDVAPVDTTIDWTAGTPFHIAIDGRDHTNVKFYVNGVRVASGTTFKLTAASGPLKAIFHAEKGANSTPGVFEVDMLRVRIQE